MSSDGYNMLCMGIYAKSRPLSFKNRTGTIIQIYETPSYWLCHRIYFQNRYKSIVCREDIYLIEPGEVFSKGRQEKKVKARSLLCYWSSKELGISHTSPARRLEMSISNIGLSVERGELIAREGKYTIEKQD